MSESEEELARRLRRMVDEADPVPAVVVEAARAAFGWRRLDAELAELLEDSVAGVGTPALTRSTDAPLRSMTFATERDAIDLTVTARKAARLLRGQLSPAARATVEVQRADGTVVASTRCDDLGRFVVEAPGGTLRLRIAGTASGDAIETAWVAV